jgi:hypothetical protein
MPLPMPRDFQDWTNYFLIDAGGKDQRSLVD